MKSGLVGGVLALLVILFALTVWPTPYRYHPNAFYINGNAYTVREHRVTGRMSYMFGSGWVDMEPAEAVDEARR
jgi:hypothetical protein